MDSKGSNSKTNDRDNHVVRKWNPRLSTETRELLEGLLKRMSEFYRQRGGRAHRDAHPSLDE